MFVTGVGFATMTVVFLIDTYYSVIIAWTLFYLIASFTKLPALPWEDCSQLTQQLTNSFNLNLAAELRRDRNISAIDFEIVEFIKPENTHKYIYRERQKKKKKKADELIK